jgi:hypothetical protein
MAVFVMRIQRYINQAAEYHSGKSVSNRFFAMEKNCLPVKKLLRKFGRVQKFCYTLDRVQGLRYRLVIPLNNYIVKFCSGQDDQSWNVPVVKTERQDTVSV